MIDSPFAAALGTLTVGSRSARIYRANRCPGVQREKWLRRPFTTRVLVENLLRRFDPSLVNSESVISLANGDRPPGDVQFPFFPSRILLQDFTGVPVLVDLTGMRTAAQSRGIDPKRVDPTIPVDLVVDHSVQVDSYGSKSSLLINLDREYERNGERYELLRWARSAFRGLRIVPPGNGIVHQVNLEYLASVVTIREETEMLTAFPDTLLGTDSHTTMVNGLGVLGWGVGGIEAEAAMLGEPYFQGLPRVVGVRLDGQLPEGATATDLVLTVTRLLRDHGVVDKFVEFYGPGLEHLSVQDRATISNMSPEFGATASLFPIDRTTLAYLRSTGRDEVSIQWVEAYARATDLWHEPGGSDPEYDERVELDLADVVPTVSGPRNPEEATPLSKAAESFSTLLQEFRKLHPNRPNGPMVTRPYPADDPLLASAAEPAGGERSKVPPAPIQDGSVVIAAITSCTNTSNPTVMVGAGLVAQRAVQKGLKVPPHVKTSLAPGSKVVTDYLKRAGLLEPLDELGFELVGYGCTTCIGNSGPLPPSVAQAVTDRDLCVAAVLSGNRNFEARIHNLVRANYLASPMLVVAYALAGRVDTDLTTDPLGTGSDGAPVFLKDLWPPSSEIREAVERCLDPAMYRDKYRSITEGDHHWEQLRAASGVVYPWQDDSTYLRSPPFFEKGALLSPRGPILLEGARVLVVAGDKVSTDHISPAGSITKDSPAGRYLIDRGVRESEFNTYGSRRGNHEVMVRGTFANVRFKNHLVAPAEGGFTLHLPDGERTTIFEGANQYREENVPLIVLAGASYGQGSSRDWAAKGPRLLGVRCVIAQSYERIHRSNLVGMGILPLEFLPGEGWQSLGLTGREIYTLRLADGARWGPGARIVVDATAESGEKKRFEAVSRIDGQVELSYFEAGGLLPYVLDRL